jgi:transcriptional regulator with XRE-family HTH domain
MSFRYDLMRRRREAVFENRAAFARALGESESKVGTWERGQHEPRATQVARIARVLGLDLAELFNETSDRS